MWLYIFRHKLEPTFRVRMISISTYHSFTENLRYIIKLKIHVCHKNKNLSTDAKSAFEIKL